MLYLKIIPSFNIFHAFQIFGGFLSPAMPNLVQLLGLYHNYSHVVELVLEVFAEAAKRTLCYLVSDRQAASLLKGSPLTVTPTDTLGEQLKLSLYASLD